MLTTFATLAALTLAQQGETDTTVAVQSGARLDVNNFGGEIVVRSWNQNNVRVRATHSSRDHVQVSYSAGAVLVRASGRRGPSSVVDFEISVPTWMGVTLGGTYTDITVEGVAAPISAESVQGDITVSGGSGNITLKSIEGDVTLSKARGRMEISTVEGNLQVTDVSGELSVESVDGDVTLLRVESSSVEVNTVDGDIVYDGTIRDGGSYRLATHDGDVAVGIPPSAGAIITVASFEGEFDSCFPVNVTETRKHRFTFTIGSGKARLELETFDGDIRLCRPGQVGGNEHEQARQKHQEKNRNHNEEP
jgi:DUF4097 and DUF4098 domain-containing protein YvlB